MRKQIVLVFVLFFTLFAQAQMGVSGGFSTVKAIGFQEWYKGMHIGLEFPKDDMVSYFGRITTTLPYRVTDTVYATAIQPTTSPYIKQVSTSANTSFFNIEGGNRYYIGNGYDYGWSAYGGSVFSISTMGVKIKPSDDYDPSLYQIVDANGAAYPMKGRLYAFGLGLNVGVKHHFSAGMVYFDMTGCYVLGGFASNTTAQTYSRFSALNFAFNLGFRRDIY